MILRDVFNSPQSNGYLPPKTIHQIVFLLVFFQDIQNVFLFLEANCIGTSAKRKVLAEILVRMV